MRPHNLRKFHASQLAESGMSTDHIDLLQGRKAKGIAHTHYIRINPERIKEEYIKALPFLVINDVNKYKSELEILKQKNEIYESKQEKINEILKRLERLENL